MNDIGASVLRTRGLRKEYGKGEGLVRAVDAVDLDVASGECPTTWRAVLPDPHG